MHQRKNKLTSICDELFPEFTQICKNPNLPSALALRQAFPTSAALASASLSVLQAARRGGFPRTRSWWSCNAWRRRALAPTM